MLQTDRSWKLAFLQGLRIFIFNLLVSLNDISWTIANLRSVSRNLSSVASFKNMTKKASKKRKKNDWSKKHFSVLPKEAEFDKRKIKKLFFSAETGNTLQISCQQMLEVSFVVCSYLIMSLSNLFSWRVFISNVCFVELNYCTMKRFGYERMSNIFHV